MRTTRGLPSATTIWVYSTLLALGYLAGQPSEPVAAPAAVVQAAPAAESARSPLAAIDPLPVRGSVTAF
ncbi:MAG TPA: hypothetical protein VJM11_00030 [Nevskiaceae bacterium]|nr:hypothetical protein [Nevskiaceae bacterium]